MVIALLLSWATGRSPLEMLGLVSQVEKRLPQTSQSAPANPNDPGVDFARAILGDTEDTWGAIFQCAGRTYQQPHLVLYSGAVQSACGGATSAAGPFYCPGDQRGQRYRAALVAKHYFHVRQRKGPRNVSAASPPPSPPPRRSPQEAASAPASAARRTEARSTQAHRKDTDVRFASIVTFRDLAEVIAGEGRRGGLSWIARRSAGRGPGSAL